MPRPRKTGLDYFPFDCDFFEDEKIIAIAGEFGIKGELAVVKLLCAIYRNGYFIEWTEMLKMKMLHRLPGVSSELLEQILNRLVRWGFFDASLFGSVKVLTSVGIQRRYFNILKRCKKDDDYPYLLVNVTETRVNVTETRVNVTETPQRKENKSKIKISPDGDKKSAAAVDDFDEVVNDFFSPTKSISFESFCKTNRTTPERLRELSEEIIAEWRLQGISHFDRKDASRHLLNTLRIKLKDDRKNDNSGRYSPRGGVPIRGKFTPGCGLVKKSQPKGEA